MYKRVTIKRDNDGIIKVIVNGFIHLRQISRAELPYGSVTLHITHKCSVEFLFDYKYINPAILIH